MEKTVTPKVDLNELIDMLDWDELDSFVDTKTGKIVTLMDEDEEIEEDCEEGDIPDHYISLPGKWDINKYDIMEEFCCEVEDEEMQVNLLNAIRGNGAFGRFKTAIHCYNIEDDWYQFLHESLKEIAIEFCKNNGLAYHYKPRKN